MKSTQAAARQGQSARGAARPVFATIALAANLLFYLAVVLHDGPVICVDTPSYINMAYSREPVYPTFLWLLRQIFGTVMTHDGTEYNLVAAVVIQAIVMAVCVWYTSRVVAGILPGRGPILREQWRIAIRRERVGDDASAATDEPAAASVYASEVVLYAIANLAFWGVDLLNRFAAARGSMYVECIMTESLCIPLFYVFLARAYLLFQEQRRGDLAWLCLLMCLMMSIRKQEMITCVILCGFAFLYDLVLNHRWQRFLACVAACIIAFGAMTLLDYSYNYVSRGVWMHHTHNYKGAACTFLYTASAEDAALFEDPFDRAIYEDIYEQMEEQGLTYDSVDERDWLARTDHYAAAYDIIGYDILIPTIERYMEEAYPDLDRPHMQIAIDEEQNVIQRTLLRQDKSRLIELWCGNFIEGFVNTVLRKTHLLARVAAGLYALYAAGFLLLVWQCRQQRDRLARRVARAAARRVAARSASNGGMPSERMEAASAGTLPTHDAAQRREPDGRPALLFACLVAFAIMVNVIVVGSMIFTQTRYMIYNMAFFYIALAVMAGAILRLRPARK